LAQGQVGPDRFAATVATGAMGCNQSSAAEPEIQIPKDVNLIKPPAVQELAEGASRNDQLGDPFSNIVMLSDSYKVTHHLQYPPNTTHVYSYFECRGGEFEEVCFFGLQYFLKRYMVGEVVTKAKISEAQHYFESHFAAPGAPMQAGLFNRKGWEHLVQNHAGRLPVKIKAVPEGTVVSTSNVLFTLENTDPKCHWLTNYLESLLVQVWYPTTVCTQSREQKKIIRKFMTETGTADEGKILFKLHDFGFRGVSSVESAGLGGAGHLVNFKGTDTLAALVVLKEYYGEDCGGFSIPASEHSTITSWGKEGECAAMKNMLDKYPEGLVACVSDSFDVFKACEQYWGTDLKDQIMSRKGTLVVRPDSGDLPGTVLKILDTLGKKFGTKETETKHKILPDNIRMIQGDGINIKTLDQILSAMKKEGWAADNIAFGSGGALLQKLHRDTLKCAFKCSSATVDGKERNVQKDPVTDQGKRSKQGRLKLVKVDGKYETKTEGQGAEKDDQLVLVFENGELKVDHKFDAIIKRAAGEEVPVPQAASSWVPKMLWKPLKAIQRGAEHMIEHGHVEADPLHNILLLTDSYKVSHHKQYPPDTKKVYSYFESRGAPDFNEEVVFFGLQYFLKRFLVGAVVDANKISEAEVYFKAHLSQPGVQYDPTIFYRQGWEHILNKCGGKLPISIKAVPEGTVCGARNVLFTMENTDDACFWLTNYLETLLVQVWYPTTVCTQSRLQRQIIQRFLTSTGTPEVATGLYGFKLHDFGFRGVSSVESAAIGGAAHLVNFMGTDNLAALVCAKECYHEENAGFSIPASEHSTITSWGRDKEKDALQNMLTQYPKGIVACVSDSYDVFKACREYWGTDLKEQIMQREGTLVVRPDSGPLPKTVVDVLEELGKKFEPEKTATGHKLLPRQIRVIQGDGIDFKSLEVILVAMDKAGWAADNLAFGSGGALLQKVNRDTMKFAFKCSSAVIGDKVVEVFKDPITDKGKRSKKGRLALTRSTQGAWFTANSAEGDAKPEFDHLVEVFKNGELLVDQTFAKIKARANMILTELPAPPTSTTAAPAAAADQAPVNAA